MEPVRHDYRYQRWSAGKQKVGMKCPGILCLAISKTETVFDVIDGALDRCADLVGSVPFFRSTDNSGVEAEILFWVDVDHTSAVGSCAGISAVAATMMLSIVALVPAHFGTDELIGFQATAQV